jgi:formylglycine-generating enzyme required for sulfatase activity
VDDIAGFASSLYKMMHPVNGTAWTDSCHDKDFHVMRGGNEATKAEELCSSQRFHAKWGTKEPLAFIGFRLARTL